MSPSFNKYWGIVWNMVEKSDVVVEVVDARFPSICRSNRLEERVQELDDCNLLIALNKSDLIPRDHLHKWIDWFDEEENLQAVGVSAKKRLGTSRIRRTILSQSNKDNVTVAIVGFPNTGKSSLINTLKGRKAAPTAPDAGFTKAMQKIRISQSLMMFDTPGVLPAQIPEKHKHLLGVTSINRLDDPIGVAYSLFEQLEEISPGVIGEYYDIEADSYEFLEELALKKNRLISGGKPDIRMAAIIFLKDHIHARIPVYEDVENPLRFN